MNNVQSVTEEKPATGYFVGCGYLRQRRLNRLTGTFVCVYDTNAPENDFDKSGGRWVTFCEAHATICNHKTQALAEQHACSIDWCEDCQKLIAQRKEAKRKPEFFAFEINEFKYRRIHFSRHSTRERAERAASKNAKNFKVGEDSVTKDVTPMIMDGRLALEAWAKECSYEIDWKKKLLIYRGEERQS